MKIGRPRALWVFFRHFPCLDVGMQINVSDLGAVGDGQSLDHDALQRGLDLCRDQGGGTLFVPAGTYLCGTLQIGSNTTLYLEMGARLLSCEDPALYPVICPTPFGNLPGQIQALLWAENAENVQVCGPGVIDGGHPEALSPADAAPLRFRPALVFFRSCRNVVFQDLTLQWSSFWTLHLLHCDDVRIQGVRIQANLDRINADGIDPDGCRNVTISDCHIVSGDDSICIKSTEGRPCENIAISNCIVQTNCAALKIGTEAMGPIRNILFNNCVVRESSVALALYLKDGSIYENMIFSNMTIESQSQFPILVDQSPRYHKEPRKGSIRSILFNNLLVRGPGRIHLEGIPGYPLQNITFRGITWQVTGALKTSGLRKPPGARRTDPDPAAPNFTDEPYQITAAHVEGLILDDIRLLGDPEDASIERGFLRLEHGKDVTVRSVRSVQAPAGVPVFQIRGSEEVELPD